MLQTCEALSPPVLPKIAPIPSSFWLLSSTLPAGSTEIHSLKANLKLLSMWTLSLISQSVNVGRGARGNTSQNITKQQTELDPKEGRQTDRSTDSTLPSGRTVRHSYHVGETQSPNDICRLHLKPDPNTQTTGKVFKRRIFFLYYKHLLIPWCHSANYIFKRKSLCKEVKAGKEL